jgi:SsrA-binding protein
MATEPKKMTDKAKAPEAGTSLIAQNKKAFFDYHVEKKYEAGLVLMGSEVKSCRNARVQLVDAYASIEKGEMYIYKIHIAEYNQGGPYFNHTPTRKRKLLLHKKEIRDLGALVEQQGYTLVPLRMYFRKGRAKIEIGLAKGKTKGDKRASQKEKQDTRNIARAIRRSRDDD